MADFDISYSATCQNEGGYTTDPHETFMGVDRVMQPHWIGWHLIDEKKGGPGFPHNLKSCQPLLDAVRTFFQQAFWIPVAGTALASQELANHVYDAAVNMGTKTAVRILQRVLGVEDDGIMGSKTISAANTPPFDETIAKFRAERKQYYYDIVETHPEDKRYLKSWLSRC